MSVWADKEPKVLRKKQKKERSRTILWVGDFYYLSIHPSVHPSMYLPSWGQVLLWKEVAWSGGKNPVPR